jgi:Actin
VEIVELRPLNPFIQVSPLGCKALHKRLTYLLTHHTTPAFSTPIFETIEDFLIRALYTSPHPTTLPPISTGLIPNESLQSVYEPQTPGTLAWFVPPQKHELVVPRWIPACTPELFFEGDREDVLADTDEMGLVSNVMNCLARLPNHVRAKVIKGIVVVGGGAAIPGLRTRLRNDLQKAWDLGVARPTTPVSVSGVEGEELSMADLSGGRESALRFCQAEALEATFWGGSMLGDIKVRGLVEVTRDGFNGSFGRGVGDWSFIGGVGEDVVEEGKRRSR